MPGTTFRSSNPARLTAFAEPKCASSARLLAEPTPGIPESGESSILFFRLVPDALDEIKQRVVLAKLDLFPSAEVKHLATGIPIRTLRNSNNRHRGNSQFADDGQPCRQLTRAAVDYNQIRPIRRVPVGILFDQPGEPAGEHFLHHREIVAGPHVVPIEIEFAIARLHEPVLADDDHRAHRRASLNMRIVEHLDALGRAFQVQQFGQSGKQFLLDSRFGLPSRQRFLGVAHGILDQNRFLSSSRHHQPDLAAEPVRKHLLHKVGVVDPVRQNNLLRRHVAHVELAQKAFQHLMLLRARSRPREVGVIAPILVRPDEKHLHASLVARELKTHDVRFIDGFRIYALDGLNLRQSLYSVSEHGGALELQLLRRRFHVPRQLLLNIGRLSRQKPLCVIDEFGVRRFADVADARRGAALYLIQQARPRAVLERRFRAIPEQKNFLELIQRAIHSACGCEGAEVIALLLLRPTMLLDPRKARRPRNQNVGKALVVPQQDVEPGLELLDQVLLQQQCLGFGSRGQEHHRRRGRHHAGDARAVSCAARVAPHARSEISRLSDVEDFALFAVHPVDAGASVQNLHVMLDALDAPEARRDIGAAFLNYVNGDRHPAFASQPA